MCSWYLTHELCDDLWRGALTYHVLVCALVYSSAANQQYGGDLEEILD